MTNKNKTPKDKLEEAKKIASKHNVNTAFETTGGIILHFFRWISSLIDKIFFSNRNLAIFSLVLSFLALYVATYDSSSTSLSNAKIMSNIIVNTRYNSETFELSGAPTACEIVLTGDAANVNNAASRKGSCQINLEGYTEGTHTVPVTAVGFGDSVNTIVSPNEVTVTLKKKTTMQFDLSYDYINLNSLDSRYIISEPSFSFTGKINIRASQDTLNSIALVKALIDVSGQTSDCEIEAPLVAYDSRGQAVNAEIVPSSVKVSVKISSPSNEVPIKINPIGQAPNGLAIDSVQIVDHQTTRIYAPESVLATISEIYADFDLSTINENVEKEIMLPVTIPTGVSASDVTYVNVKVSLSTVESKVIESIPLTYVNNVNNLAVSEIDKRYVDVTVSGSASNVDLVRASDITVYFEMPETSGTYNLPLYVVSEKNPFVTFKLSSSSITITTVEANE